MATIQSPGIGSGLDVNNIVSQLMDLERQPLDKLQSKKSIVNAQISAYGSLKSKISEFETAMSALGSADKFQVFTATATNEDVFTATANSEAAAGSYSIQVNALAERDKIATKAYTDSNTVVGEGTLTISVGSNSFDVVVDGSNNTVQGIRDAINSSADNTGVTATIINDVNGAQLIFTTNETGVDNALKIEVADSSDGSNIDESGLSALAYESGVVEFRPPITSNRNAEIEVDGFVASSSSNTFAGVLEGVSFDAKEIGSSTLTIARDDEAIKESVKKFADSFNALRTEINTQRQGQLEADSTLLTIERQLFGILNSGSSITGSNQSYLVEVGLTIDKLGVMSVDDSTLNDVLDTDFDSFANLFAAEDEGFAARLESFASQLIQSDGLIKSREDGLKIQVDDIEDQSLKLELRLETIELRIRSQYSALDTLISELSSSGNFLTQQLANLSGNNNN